MPASGPCIGLATAARYQEQECTLQSPARLFVFSDGTYEISLHLVAVLLVPLPALAERIRSSVEAAAAEAGLADVLGPIDVAFEDVREAAV